LASALTLTILPLITASFSAAKACVAKMLLKINPKLIKRLQLVFLIFLPALYAKEGCS